MCIIATLISYITIATHIRSVPATSRWSTFGVEVGYIQVDSLAGATSPSFRVAAECVARRAVPPSFSMVARHWD